MGYTQLTNSCVLRQYPKNGLGACVRAFIRENCEDLRFDAGKEEKEDHEKKIFLGSSLKENQIPYNMQMDIDRLCLERALERFLQSGKKEDAFDVYFCYLEMFIGDYEKTRRMIELLSEFEANGSGLLMKHRDHYSHSVYVFALGLAIYQSNEIYRKKYQDYCQQCCGLSNEHQVAHHYLQYWGLTSLFHDIGYPFELPFEQVASYFEVTGEDRKDNPYIAYHALDKFINIDAGVQEKLEVLYDSQKFSTTNELFAYVLYEKLGKDYGFSYEQMNQWLDEKPTEPNEFGYYMDHAYFSATVLFQKLFGEMQCKLTAEHLDALIAILIHNSLYKFKIADYKNADKPSKPLKAEKHPLAYMLMLCDELQCWDRTAYGRNSKKELHPMGCNFDFSNDGIKAVYLFDKKEVAKIDGFKDSYIKWLQGGKEKNKGPKLKAYSSMYIKNENDISAFQADIERIVDTEDINRLSVETGLYINVQANNKNYLSDSKFINLYNFAIILNGRWDNEDWKAAKNAGQEEKFLSDDKEINKCAEQFKKLSLEYKLSNINQAKAFARYMNEIGCFYSDKSVDFEMVDRFNQEELIKIGILEHQRWLQEHYDMGWTYGTPDKAERDYKRQHKDMIPEFDALQSEVSLEKAKENYDRLDKGEQDKDTEPMECMLAMLKMFDGLRIYRLN